MFIVHCSLLNDFLAQLQKCRKKTAAFLFKTFQFLSISVQKLSKVVKNDQKNAPIGIIGFEIALKILTHLTYLTPAHPTSAPTKKRPPPFSAQKSTFRFSQHFQLFHNCANFTQISNRHPHNSTAKNDPSLTHKNHQFFT